MATVQKCIVFQNLYWNILQKRWDYHWEFAVMMHMSVFGQICHFFNSSPYISVSKIHPSWVRFCPLFWSGVRVWSCLCGSLWFLLWWGSLLFFPLLPVPVKEAAAAPIDGITALDFSHPALLCSALLRDAVYELQPQLCCIYDTIKLSFESKLTRIFLPKWYKIKILSTLLINLIWRKHLLSLWLVRFLLKVLKD